MSSSPLPRLALSLLAGAILAVGAVAGCGGDSGSGSGGSSPASSGADAGASSFATLARQARGQTVRWWMYGGDPRINAYVDRQVAPAAKALGVTLQRVPVADTADALQRVIAQRRAGRSTGGAVDLIWINGENFAAGKKAGLWLKDWAGKLPNRRYVDTAAPLIARDFQVPVDGQESPWSGAGFVFAHDSAKVARPPRSFGELLAYAKAHPGRVAYPAPPDYTGSAFVRQAIQRSGGQEQGLALLRELRPYTYKKGRSYPKSEQELSELFANGQVDFAMSYDAVFVESGVRSGKFPKTTRPFLMGGGALQNTSYVTVPANAAHAAGAQVVANLLLEPRQQMLKADPKVLGNPTVLDLARLPAEQRAGFERLQRSPYLLRDLGRPLTELPADRVAPIEQAWTREVLR